MKDRLIFEKIKDLHCNNCFFYPERRCQFGSIFMCSGSDAYKLVEEPEEIQSEFDWKNERYEILSNSKNRDHMKEIYELEKWLKDNPKECWETCCRKNIKIGDVVRNIATTELKIVKYILNKHSTFILEYEGEDSQYNMIYFEINIHKQGDR